VGISVRGHLQKKTATEHVAKDESTPKAYLTVICEVVKSKESRSRKNMSHEVSGSVLNVFKGGHRFAVALSLRRN
jgi:hypothetical protein